MGKFSEQESGQKGCDLDFGRVDMIGPVSLTKCVCVCFFKIKNEKLEKKKEKGKGRETREEVALVEGAGLARPSRAL